MAINPSREQVQERAALVAELIQEMASGEFTPEVERKTRAALKFELGIDEGDLVMDVAKNAYEAIR